MAFWGKSNWQAAGSAEEGARIVEPWDGARIESSGYRLSIGSEYFVNGEASSTVTNLAGGEAFVVAPGQFAFILTAEKVRVPEDAIGFISIRASIKFRGLVNVSGFQVNPGFNGKLVFAVFNAGPRHIHLRHGDEIFSLWLADLSERVNASEEEGGAISATQSEIPSKFINDIGGEALTAYQLSEQMKALKDEVVLLKNVAYRWLPIIATIAFILMLAAREPVGRIVADLLGFNEVEEQSESEKPDSDAEASGD